MPTKGLDRNSQHRVQFVQETDAGNYDVAGIIRTGRMFRLEEQPETAWSKFKPAGYNSDDWSAKTREHRILSGPIRLDFNEMDFLAQCLAGEVANTSSAGGVDTFVFYMPESDAVNRIPQTIERGLPARANRATYGIMSELSMNMVRMEENSEGTTSFFARRPEPEAGGQRNVPMTRQGQVNEVQTVTIPTGTGASQIAVPASSLGVGGTATWSDTSTVDQVVALLAALSAIGNAANVKVVKTTVGTDRVFTITYRGQLAGANIAPPTSVTVGVVIATVTPGLAGTFVQSPARKPILQQNWTHRRADTLAGLDAATPTKKVAMMSLTFPQMVDIETFFDNENQLDFNDHFDTEYDIKAALRVVNGTADCDDLEAKSEESPARGEWHRFQARHKDGIHIVQIDGYFSVDGNIPFTVGKNVRYREFPLGLKINDQGWALRLTVKKATA